MLKQNGIIVLTDKELGNIIKEKINELELRNEMLRKAILQLTAKDNKSREVKDVRVSKVDFLKIYDDALNDMFDNPMKENNDIYGYDVTVHWHGMYCNCSDGATAYNYIISSVKDCNEEDDEEY